MYAQNSLVLQQIQNEFKLHVIIINNHVITWYHCSKEGLTSLIYFPFYSEINMSNLCFIISRKVSLSSWSGNHSSCDQNGKVSFIQCPVHLITKYELKVTFYNDVLKFKTVVYNLMMNDNVKCVLIIHWQIISLNKMYSIFLLISKY